MRMLQCLAIGAALCAAPSASADTLGGQLQYHNQVIYQAVTVENMQGLAVWTDSNFFGGFDPILAVWNGSGSLIGISDDAPLNSQAGAFDASILIPVLEAGTYTIGLSLYGNFPSGSLGDGYWYDADAPVAVQNSGCDAVCASYRMHWVTGNTLPVPEPATYAMLLAGVGIAGLGGLRGRRREQAAKRQSVESR